MDASCRAAEGSNTNKEKKNTRQPFLHSKLERNVHNNKESKHEETF